MVAIGDGAYNSYLKSIGQAVRKFAHPVIFTFAQDGTKPLTSAHWAQLARAPGMS
ncbi:MAG TPA: hypothetical protein VHV09_10145 [Trebonia sp.]|jgi:hypothetical protein|nr:hypothetical protein [Trebonia sp.]